MYFRKFYIVIDNRDLIDKKQKKLPALFIDTDFLDITNIICFKLALEFWDRLVSTLLNFEPVFCCSLSRITHVIFKYTIRTAEPQIFRSGPFLKKFCQFLKYTRNCLRQTSLHKKMKYSFSCVTKFNQIKDPYSHTTNSHNLSRIQTFFPTIDDQKSWPISFSFSRKSIQTLKTLWFKIPNTIIEKSPPKHQNSTTPEPKSQDPRDVLECGGGRVCPVTGSPARKRRYSASVAGFVASPRHNG